MAEVVRRAKAKNKKWCPWDPYDLQATFSDDPALEALFGGQAGPGKSVALLIAALKYANVPGYSAVIFRRTFVQLSAPGGLMLMANEWLRGSEARPGELGKRWTFPSGAILTFAHLQHEKDKYNHQGPSYQFVGFDELTQFTLSMYTYLVGRCRRPSGDHMELSKVPLRVRSTSNPGGPGHNWVKKRFVEPSTRGDRVFIPAKLDDNPHIDKEEYRKALAQLEPEEYRQLALGEWIQGGQGLVYKYDHERNAVPSLPKRNDWVYILAIDLGASEAKPTTAFVVMAFSPHIEEVYAVESEVQAGMIPSTIAERILELRETYGDFERVVMDTGALGKGYKGEMQKRWSIPITDAKKSDKLGYRKLANGDLRASRAMIVESTNSGLIEEMQELPWNEAGTDNEKGHENHRSDAWLYGWRECRHYRSVILEPEPEEGTPEHFAKIEREIKRRRVAELKEKTSWDKRRSRQRRG